MDENWTSLDVVSEKQLALRPLGFGGHCFLIRRCLPGDDSHPNDPLTCVSKGIVLPPGRGNQTVWFELVAIGPKVGQRCSAKHARKYRMGELGRYGRFGEKKAVDFARQPSFYPNDIVVPGKLFFIPMEWPATDVRVAGVPWNDYENFIEETLPQAIISEDALWAMSQVA